MIPLPKPEPTTIRRAVRCSLSGWSCSRAASAGTRAVCLTFKNISRVNLTALDVRFKCKTTGGEILCEDEFAYQGLDIKPGELFGMDDAVFITQKPITSVDVVLKNVYKRQACGPPGQHQAGAAACPPPPAGRPGRRPGRTDGPQGNGVRPPGAGLWLVLRLRRFHPKEEDTVYCSECGSDRILLQNALNTLMQPEQPPEEDLPAPEAEAEPTRIAGAC